MPHGQPPEPGRHTSREVERPPPGVPRPFIAGHRGQVVIAIYALVVTTLIVVIASVSGSIMTACVFAALLTAAASILVLPAVVALLCAAESLETNWLCRRHDGFRRWIEARTGNAETKTAAQRPPGARAEYWRTLTSERLRSEVARLLQGAGCRVEKIPVQEDAGVDLVATRGPRRAVVRCWADLDRCGPAVAREVLAAQGDFDAHLAVIVAPAGASSRLREYRQRRKFLLVDATDLMAAELHGGLEPFDR